MNYTSNMSTITLAYLLSKSLYHIIHTISLSTCQLVTIKEHFHHLKPCSGRLQTGAKHIALCIKHMLWVPTTEVQDAPYIETPISI